MAVAARLDHRFRWLWVGLFAGDAAGLAFVAALLPVSTSPITRLDVFLAAVVLITTTLAAAPFIRFLDSGWQVRFEEIRNKLSDGKLKAYLGQFWRLRVAQALHLNPADQTLASHLGDAEAAELFTTIYREQYGRRAFVTPLALLIVVIFVDAVMVVVLRRGVISFPAMSEDTLRTALAAVAGAYFFVVGDGIGCVRRRSLNIADLYSYALRMVLAAPIGMSVSLVVAPALGALVAFGAASLPVDELTKLIRQLTYSKTGSTDAEVKNDELTRLSGVTLSISAQLAQEGVASVEQLIGMDPVLLTIRTGLPFKLMLRLASQAITGRYITGAAAALLPVGLGDAPAIAALVATLDSADPVAKAIADTILADAAQRMPGPAAGQPMPKETLKFQFDRIAADEYTRFLVTP